MTWSPTVVTGLRLVIGSWKIMPMRAPRTARISGTGSESRSRPSKAMRAPGSMRPGRGTRRMMASAVIDLPLPELADQRQRLAGGDGDPHAVDDPHALARRRERRC